MRTQRHHYQIFGLHLGSDADIPELPAAGAGNTDLRFSVAEQACADIGRLRWDHVWRDTNERVSITCATTREASFLQFPHRADFRIDHNELSILGYPHPGTSLAITRQLLIDQVIPRTLAQQGNIILHASAVRVKHGCIAFLGPSGAGKSTLAASFIDDGREPFADDALRVISSPDGVRVIPSYPGLRIWPSSADTFGKRLMTGPLRTPGTDKQRYLPAGPVRAPERLRLLAVFTLDTDQETPDTAAPKIRRSPGAEPFDDLLRHTFVMNPRSRRYQVDQFRSLTSLANAGVEFFHLSYPRRFDQLPRVRTAVLDAIGGRRQ